MKCLTWECPTCVEAELLTLSVLLDPLPDEVEEEGEEDACCPLFAGPCKKSRMVGWVNLARGLGVASKEEPVWEIVLCQLKEDSDTESELTWVAWVQVW